MKEVGAPISLDGMAVHPDCWCICLCYLHFAPENPENGKMYLLVPDHLDCPGQSPESREMVVGVVIVVVAAHLNNAACNGYCTFESVHPNVTTLRVNKSLVYCFYARQHICYSAYMPWQFRLSVCLSVCLSVRLSVTRVDQSKTVEARIMQFSPYSSPIPLLFRG